MAALDILELVVRHADRANEALVGELGHRTPRLLERDAGVVRPVQEVDVDVLSPESPQALAAGSVNLLGTEAAPAAGHGRARSHLRCDQEFARDPTQRAADHRLVPRLEVVLGCVQPVDARRERDLDHTGGPLHIRLLARLRSQLVSVAGAATAAERGARARPDPVDLDPPDAHATGDGEGARHVRRPHRPGEAERCPVGDGQRLVLGVVGQDAQHRPEDLLLGQ